MFGPRSDIQELESRLWRAKICDVATWLLQAFHGGRRRLWPLRMPGVEPGSQAWEACMMPLHYMRSEDLKRQKLLQESIRKSALNIIAQLANALAPAASPVPPLDCAGRSGSSASSSAPQRWSPEAAYAPASTFLPGCIFCAHLESYILSCRNKSLHVRVTRAATMKQLAQTAEGGQAS